MTMDILFFIYLGFIVSKSSVHCQLLTYNIAHMAQLKSSSVLTYGTFNYSTTNAIDENPATLPDECNCCWSSGNEDDPWLEVTLPRHEHLVDIVLQGRTDHTDGPRKLSGLNVQADGIKVPDKWTFVNSTQNSVSIDLQNKPVKSILISRPKMHDSGGEWFLIVCEVYINIQVVELFQELRETSKTSQTGLFKNDSDYGSSKAIDGLKNYNLDACKCCSVTADADPPISWWHIDLKKNYTAYGLELFGREKINKVDNKQIQNAKIYASNSSMEDSIDTGYLLFVVPTIHDTTHFIKHLQRPVIAQYFIVSISNTLLALCEIIVYGKVMRWALILYDEDGFTSIEKSTSLTGNIKQTSVCKLKITNGQTYKVEILQLADTKAELNKYAKNWGLTHRALAIHNAIKKCKGSKKGGFLSVWPSDEENNIATDRGIIPTSISTDLVAIGTTSPDITSSPTAIEGTSTNMDNIPANGLPRSEKIQGKNDRAITVLFEGAGDYTDTQADPRRSPYNTDMLTIDQADLLSLQVTQSEANSRSFGSQTLPVVVTKTVQDIQDLCAKPTCVDAATQCDNECSCPCAANSEKIEKILEMVIALDNKFENKFNTSLVSVDFLENVLNNSTRNETIISRVAAEETSENETNTCPSPKTTTTQEPGITFQEIGETEETAEMSCEKENYVLTPIPNEPLTLTLPQDVDQTSQLSYVLDASSSLKMIKEKHFSHPCYLGGIAEICSENDIPTDRNELRIHADLVRQARLNACSIGNFGWILVRKVFSNDELIGKNYNGKRGKAGLSPRRIHAIEHACLDSYGPGPNVNKLAKAVNTGLRNFDFALPKRPVFRPLV